MVCRHRLVIPFLVLAISVFVCVSSSNKDGLIISNLKKSASSSPIQFTDDTLYGPYDGGETVHFKWSYKNTSSINYGVVNDYFIVNCKAYSSAPLITKRVGRHSLDSGSEYTLSCDYKMPYERLHSYSGIVIKVGILYEGEYLAMLEKTLRPISNTWITPINYRVSPFKIKDRSFYFNDVSVEESFCFNEYRDYVECDQYNRLLFGSLSFIYSYPKTLTFTSARIKFIDRVNLFPKLKRDEDGYASVDINLIDKSGVITIEIPSIYYDPLTLKMNQDGIGVKSKYLYVPKGKANKINNYEFIIEAEGLGINKIGFSHCMETSVSPFFLGDCETADYCVVGGVRE